MAIEDQNQNQIDDVDEATIGMEEIDEFDFGRALMLMSVMEKVAGVAPKANAIFGIAQAALNEMAEEAKAIAKRRAEEFAKAEQKAGEKRAAEAQAQAEADAEEQEAVDDTARVPRTIPSNSPTLTDNARRL
jgi:hypothetical protein